jgi:predicted NACHT family NTPase
MKFFFFNYLNRKSSSSIKPQHLTKRTIPADYYELDEYKALKDALNRGDHILVLGAPLAGKTWAIYHALKTM